MNRHERAVETLIAQYEDKEIDRREFFKRAGAFGLSMSVAGAMLAQLRSGSAAAARMRTASPAFARAQKGGTLREGYDRDVSRLDPVNTTWWDPSLYPTTHETLIATDAHNKFVPMLAESWDTSADGLTWTFNLRGGLLFQSGAPCDAAAVVAAMKLFADPKNGVNAGFWTPVKQIQAVGKQTVKVTLKHPYADFPFVLNNGYSAIFNVKTRAKLKDKYGVTKTDGTGPFQLKEFVPGSHVTVTRWKGYPGSVVPFYANKGQPYLDEIQWQVLLDPATRAKEIEAGNLDTLRNPSPQDVAGLKANSNLAVIEFQEPSLYMFGVNFKHTELGFNDVRVRQALSHAIDRNAIAKTVFFGKADPAYTLVPSSWVYYDKRVEQYGQFDPSKAASLLDSAGWKAGAGGIRTKNGKKLSFKIIVENDKFEQLIAQAIQQMLQKVGVDMSFTVYGSDYFAKLTAGPVGFTFKNLWTNMFDASILFADSKYPVPACCNAAFATIPALDKAFDDWQHARTTAQLKNAARRAQLVAAQQLPFIPVVTPHVVWVHTKKVHGWIPTEPNLYPFYNDVWLG